jgi:hypothetical protein
MISLMRLFLGAEAAKAIPITAVDGAAIKAAPDLGR